MNASAKSVVTTRHRNRILSSRNLWAIILMIAAAVLGWQWIVGARIDNRRLKAIENATHLQPNWSLDVQIRDYEQIPVSRAYQALVRSIPAEYKGWFGDESVTNIELLLPYRYFPKGADLHVRFPLQYQQILRERLDAIDRKSISLFADRYQQDNCHGSLGDIADKEYSALCRLSNYLLDEMEWAAHQGNWAVLIDSLDIQIRLSEAVQKKPRIEFFLYGSRIQLEALLRISRALALAETNDSQLHAIASLLEKMDTHHLKELLTIRVAELFVEIEAARSNASALKALVSIYSGPFPQGLIPRFEYEIKQWQMYSPSNLKLTQAELLESFCDALHVISISPLDFQKLQHVMSRNHSTALTREYVGITTKIVMSELHRIAAARSLRMAIACERFRIQHGRFPESLAELQPQFIEELLIDPSTGMSLCYRNKAQFVVIYSIGKDGVDNNGDVLGDRGKDIGVQLYDKKMRGMTYECKAALCDTVQLNMWTRLLIGW